MFLEKLLAFLFDDLLQFGLAALFLAIALRLRFLSQKIN